MSPVARAAIILLFLLPPFRATLADEARVESVVARHLEARGGRDAIKAMRTVVFREGLYEEEGYQGSGDAFMALKRPYLKVVGNPEDPGAFMEGYDGAAWEWFEDPGVVIRTTGAASAAARHGADLEGPFVDWQAKGNTIELVGEAAIGDRPAIQLLVTLRDGFAQDFFLDRETWLIIAQRKRAPIHAFGEAVHSETRISDYRRIGGVLFAHRFVETEISTGRSLSAMQWRTIEVNRDLPESWFAPPRFQRTALGRFLEHLYVQRTDPVAMAWTYEAFRLSHPDIRTDEGVAMIGFHILKMGQVEAAVSLLEANRDDYPGSSSAASALGRAYATAGRDAEAGSAFRAALALDPENARARRGLDALGR